MLQSMGSHRVGHNLEADQKQPSRYGTLGLLNILTSKYMRNERSMIVTLTSLSSPSSLKQVTKPSGEGWPPGAQKKGATLSLKARDQEEF